MKRRTLHFLWIAAAVIVVDQLTKWLVRTKMNLHESISILGEFFEITSHRNPGAAFGILQGQRVFFIIFTIIVVIGLLWYMHRMSQEGKTLLPASLSLLMGGAIGNLIDRTLLGEVVDFFDFYFKFSLFGLDVDYAYPIFNIADMAIVVGVILILLDTLLEWRQEKKKSAVNTDV